MGLFADGNPYRDALADIYGRLALTPGDFESAVSPRNLDAVGREAQWCLCLFQAADVRENLAAAMFDDLMEAKSVGSSGSVHVCALFDGPLLTDSFFARLNPGTTLEEDIILRFLEIHSNQAGTLIELVRNAAVLYPSEKKALILSGHGGGWRGAMKDDNLWKAYPEQSRRALPENFETCVQRQAAAYHRTMAALKERLAAVSANDPDAGPFRLDVLAFDACRMANLEALCDFTDSAALLVASEDQMPGQGYPYHWILQQLEGAPNQSPREFAEMLATETFRYFGRRREALGGLSVTQTVFDCEKFPQLYDHLTALSRALVEHLDGGGRETIGACLGAAARFEEGYVDLKGFVALLLEHPVPAPLKNAAGEMIAFWDRSGFIVTAKMHSARDARPHGLSIYAPLARQDCSPGYFSAMEGKTKPPAIRDWARFLGRHLQIPGPQA